MGRAIDEGLWRVWRGRLARYERSGETVAAFCAGERVSVPAFYQWKRKLALAGLKRVSRPPGLGATAPRLEFVPVRFESSAIVEIEFPNGVCVRVPAQDVRAIEAALGAAARVPRVTEIDRC